MIGSKIFARLDTPLHSVLHESAHFVCMSPERRAGLDTDAGGDDAEEGAVCYLQILMGESLAQAGAARMCRDMDDWGYSFRLGSAGKWFEEDAEDAEDVEDVAASALWVDPGRTSATAPAATTLARLTAVVAERTLARPRSLAVTAWRSLGIPRLAE